VPPHRHGNPVSPTFLRHVSHRFAAVAGLLFAGSFSCVVVVVADDDDVSTAASEDDDDPAAGTLGLIFFGGGGMTVGKEKTGWPVAFFVSWNAAASR
jgi:hypothetical protein